MKLQTHKSIDLLAADPHSLKALLDRVSAAHLVDDEANDLAMSTLREMVAKLLAGKNVQMALPNTLLTVEEAAEYLNVRPTFVTKLIDEGVFHSAPDGQIRVDELAIYREKSQIDRRKALDELLALSEEMGAYQ